MKGLTGATIADAAFVRDVIAGLSRSPKALPSRWLYDAAGALLFEEITELEEYYPARVESWILQHYGGEIGAFIGDDVVLVEYGSGSSRKTLLLLDHLANPAVYVPIDLSQEMLTAAAAAISLRFPLIETIPVVADFLDRFDLPRPLPRFRRRAGFFPGSTVGNLSDLESVSFFTQMRRHLGPNGRSIIGFDLIKDVDRLVRAYDDSRGVTAAFNKNLLRRINRELGANFDLTEFAHQARWNDGQTRIEMHLVSRRAQSIRVGGFELSIEAGESIHTENSRKYDLGQIRRLAASAGWCVDAVWTDPDGFFAVVGFTQAHAARGFDVQTTPSQSGVLVAPKKSGETA